MLKKVAAFILLFSCAPVSFAQKVNYGIGFGFNKSVEEGVNIVSDSIVIYADRSKSMVNVYSVFGEYQLKDKIQIRSSLNFTETSVGYLLFNKDATCQFCNIRKATTVGSFNINSANSIAIKVPIKSYVDFYLLGGLRANLYFTKPNPDIEFRNGEMFQGLAEVINNVYDTVKPFNFNSIIGLKASFKQFDIVLELDKNLGDSITKNISVYGKRYRFITKRNMITVTGNYRFIKKKKTQINNSL